MQVIGLNYKIEQVVGLKRSSVQISFKFLCQINIYISECFVAPPQNSAKFSGTTK